MSPPRRAASALDVPIETVTPEQAVARFGTALPVVALGERATAAPGRPDRHQRAGGDRLDPPRGR